MAGKVISAEVSEQLNSRIEDFQQDGESRSEAVRRLLRRGLDEGPGDAALVFIFVFGVSFVAANVVDSSTAVRVESAIFHGLVLLWVAVPTVRERLRSLTD